MNEVKAYIIAMPNDERQKQAKILRDLFPGQAEVVSASLPHEALAYLKFINRRNKKPTLMSRYKQYCGLNDKLKPGEFGCALSHLKIWEKIIDTGVPALILEDDAEFIGDSVKQFQAHMAYLQTNQFPIVYFGAFRNLRPVGGQLGVMFKIQYELLKALFSWSIIRGPILNRVKSMLDQLLAYPRSLDNAKLYRAGLHDGTHAYYCSPSAARILVRINHDLIFPSDTAIKYGIFAGQIEAYVVKQLMFTQKSLLSTIDSRRDLRDISQIT